MVDGDGGSDKQYVTKFLFICLFRVIKCVKKWAIIPH